MVDIMSLNLAPWSLFELKFRHLTEVYFQTVTALSRSNKIDFALDWEGKHFATKAILSCEYGRRLTFHFAKLRYCFTI